MADTATIREISERNVKMLAMKPQRGHLTCVTKARLTDGVRCEIEEGPWKLAVDMPKKAGGDETAPNPGVLGRGALAGCLSIGIALWAARMNIPITALEVEVEVDFDARGQLGVESVQPGYEKIRYQVSIDSPAPREDLIQLIETAERSSPYLDVFGRAQTMTRALRLNGQET